MVILRGDNIISITAEAPPHTVINIIYINFKQVKKPETTG